MMKKTTIFFRLTLLLLLAIVVCCTQESIEDQLPPISQTGANTFAFAYDGVVFTPTDGNSRGFGIDGSGASGLSVYGDYSGTEHHSNRIEAIRFTNTKNVDVIYVYIYKLRSRGIGTYILEAYNSRGGANNLITVIFLCMPKALVLENGLCTILMKILEKSSSREKMKTILFFLALLVES